MKSVFYSPVKAEAEKRKKTVVKTSQMHRDAYFKALAKDKNFQKYVLEEIIQEEVNQNEAMGSNVEAMIGGSDAEIRNLVIAKVAGKRASLNILTKIKTLMSS